MVLMRMHITQRTDMSADGERLDVSSNVIIESYQISCFSPRDLSNLSLIYCSNVDGFGMEYVHHGYRCIKKNISGYLSLRLS